MEKDSSSFWSDIKKYEDIMVKEPKSYCFAPLSELYRKLGLFDDAINVARRGSEIHPEYIGGQMALGRAFYEKGMKGDAKTAFMKVVQATPENHLAQKLLSQIYIDEGDLGSAEKSLELLTAFNPEDVESRLVLESLKRSAAIEEEEPLAVADGMDASGAALFPDTMQQEGPSESLPENTYVETFTEDPIHAEFLEEHPSEFDDFDLPDEADFPDEPQIASPLPTVTLAELYEAQGFQGKALGVYEELASQEPDNQVVRLKIEELGTRADAGEVSIESGHIFDMAMPGIDLEDAKSYSPNTEVVREPISESNPVVLELEQWLDSIRRIRECR
jgi:tetratricopeptide (TPR) repeat protein